jgi:hypothetical protein
MPAISIPHEILEDRKHFKSYDISQADSIAS